MLFLRVCSVFQIEYNDVSAFAIRRPAVMKMKDRQQSMYGDSFDDENTEIKKEFKGASNIRLGVEVKPVKDFALRAGYAFYEGAYKTGENPSTQIYSFGLGYRIDNFFIDAAYKYLTSKSLYTIYSNSNTISEKYSTSQLALTVGFRF